MKKDDDILVYQIRRVPASLYLSQGTGRANARHTHVTKVDMLNLAPISLLRQTHQTCGTAFPPNTHRIPTEYPLNTHSFFPVLGDMCVIDADTDTNSSSWFSEIVSIHTVFFKIRWYETISKDQNAVVDHGNTQPTGESHLAVSTSANRTSAQSMIPHALACWRPGTWENHLSPCSMSKTCLSDVFLFVSNAVSLAAPSAQTGGNVRRKQRRTKIGYFRTQKRSVPANEYLSQTTLRTISRQRCSGTFSTLNLCETKRSWCSLHFQFACFCSDASVDFSYMRKIFVKKKVIPTDSPPNPLRILSESPPHMLRLCVQTCFIVRNGTHDDA